MDLANKTHWKIGQLGQVEHIEQVEHKGQL